jgi:hypothetical protein
VIYKKVYKLMRKKTTTREGVIGNIFEFVDTGERFEAESDEAAKVEGQKRAAKQGLGEDDYVVHESFGD